MSPSLASPRLLVNTDGIVLILQAANSVVGERENSVMVTGRLTHVDNDRHLLLLV